MFVFIYSLNILIVKKTHDNLLIFLEVSNMFENKLERIIFNFEFKNYSQ